MASKLSPSLWAALRHHEHNQRRRAGRDAIPFGNSFVGVNLTGPEYAWGTTASDDDLSYLASKRVNFVRIPTAWERWQPTLNVALNAPYVALISDLVSRAAAKGMGSIIDVHNYGRYDPNFDPPGGSPSGTYNHGAAGTAGSSYVLGSANLTQAHLADLWGKIAAVFKGTVAGYGLMNEPHDLVSVNLISNPNAFTGSGWFTTNGGALTPNVAASHYGPNDAWQFTSGGFSELARAITIPADGTYTIGIWARTTSGTQPLYGHYDFSTLSAQKNVTTTWQLFTYTFTATAGSRNVSWLLNAGAGATILVSDFGLQAGSAYTELNRATTWQNAAQAAVTAIRAVDTATPILVCGDNYGRAGDWASDNGALSVTDAANKLIYEAHLYFDEFGGGSYAKTYDAQGALPTIGATRAAAFIDWLTTHGFKGFIGEVGYPGNDPRWGTVMENAIDVLEAASIPICYWEYATKQQSDPSFWPPADPILIGSGDASQARADLLKTHAKKGPFAL